MAAFTAACLQVHHASRQEKRVIIITIIPAKTGNVLVFGVLYKFGKLLNIHLSVVDSNECHELQSLEADLVVKGSEKVETQAHA